MNANALLSALRQRGFTLWVDGDKIRWRGTKKTVSKSTEVLLRKFKTEILALLTSEEANKPPGHTTCKAKPMGWPDDVPLPPWWQAFLEEFGVPIESAKALPCKYCGYPVHVFWRAVSQPDKTFWTCPQCWWVNKGNAHNNRPGVTTAKTTPTRPWDKRAAELADWAMKLWPEDLPATPWKLPTGQTITHNAGYLDGLQKDCQRAPNCPRARTGELQTELEQLRVIVKQETRRRETEHPGTPPSKATKKRKRQAGVADNTAPGGQRTHDARTAPTDSWTPFTAALAAWILTIPLDWLPVIPWEWRPKETITDNAVFLAALQDECRQAPNCPRAKDGTLLADLMRLQEIIKRESCRRVAMGIEEPIGKITKKDKLRGKSIVRITQDALQAPCKSNHPCLASDVS